MNVRNLNVSVSIVWLLAAQLCLKSTYSQPTPLVTGNCEFGSQVGILEAGNFRAPVQNRARQQASSSGSYFEIPRGSGKVPWVNLNLWFAGVVSGELRVSAGTWGAGQFWPGPVETFGRGFDSCSSFDKLYGISQSDLELADQGIYTDNVIDWPVHLGAPFILTNTNTSDYSPEQGDRPDLLGAEMYWWIMNDLGNEGIYPNTEPVGLEIRTSAFSFETPREFQSTIFYRFNIRYVGTEPIEDVYFALFADIEIGLAGFDDDTAGSDSLLDLAFHYNKDNVDEESCCGFIPYGTPPPAIGIVLLRGTVEGEPVGGAYSIMTYDGDNYPAGAPKSADGIYNTLQGLWQDGTAVVIREEGYPWGGISDTDETTRFSLHGDPITYSFWSGMNSSGTGAILSDNARNSSVSSGPFDLMPGEELEFLFALVWSQGSDHLDSVRQLKEDVVFLRTSIDDIIIPTGFDAIDWESTRLADIEVTPVYPNPADREISVSLHVPYKGNVILRIYDVLGRQLMTVSNSPQSMGTSFYRIDSSRLPPGTYFLKADLSNYSRWRKFVIVR